MDEQAYMWMAFDQNCASTELRSSALLHSVLQRVLVLPPRHKGHAVGRRPKLLPRDVLLDCELRPGSVLLDVMLLLQGRRRLTTYSR